MREQLGHQQRSLGGPSEEISPYTKRGLVPIQDTPRAGQLWTMVDPWTYRDHFSMPKLVVLANNDPFWSTDALNLYWDALPGKKYISYSPNAGHDLMERDAAGKKLNAERAINNVAAFVRYQLLEKPLPALEWKYTEAADGGMALSVTSDPPPKQARLWIARSETRDFRKSRWESQPIDLKEGAPVTTTLPRPEKGFMACYADLGYEIDDLPQWLCTQMRVMAAGEN